MRHPFQNARFFPDYEEGRLIIQPVCTMLALIITKGCTGILVL